MVKEKGTSFKTCFLLFISSISRLSHFRLHLSISAFSTLLHFDLSFFFFFFFFFFFLFFLVFFCSSKAGGKTRKSWSCKWKKKKKKALRIHDELGIPILGSQYTRESRPMDRGRKSWEMWPVTRGVSLGLNVLRARMRSINYLDRYRWLRWICKI